MTFLEWLNHTNEHDENPTGAKVLRAVLMLAVDLGTVRKEVRESDGVLIFHNVRKLVDG